MIREWREKAEPAPVEQKCADCPRTFQRSAYAVKRVRCERCRTKRAKALTKAAGERSRARYAVSPPPCWYRSGRAAKRRLTATQRGVESTTAVNHNQEVAR